MIVLVRNFGAWKLYEKKKRNKNKKKPWTSVSTPILKDRIVSYMMATNFAIDLWMPVQRYARDGSSRKEGETN